MCVWFVGRCLSFFFWTLCCLSFDLLILITPLVSFGHYVVCYSLIYKFWLPLWYLQTLLITLRYIYTSQDWIACTKPEDSAVMYMCVRGIDLVSTVLFLFFLNCCDRVLFLVFNFVKRINVLRQYRFKLNMSGFIRRALLTLMQILHRTIKRVVPLIRVKWSMLNMQELLRRVQDHYT